MRAGTNRLQLTLDGRRWKYHHGRKSQGGDRTVGGRLGCLRSHDGKRIAVLFSHAAHPVIVHWVSEAITTDVPGYAVGHLRNLLDKYSNPQGVLMFAQGCCANINGYPLRGGYDTADAAGLSLVFAKKKTHWLMRKPFPPSRSKRPRLTCLFRTGIHLLRPVEKCWSKNRIPDTANGYNE